MFKFVNAQLAAGRKFASEAELVKYLNSLRGWLSRQGRPTKTLKATQGRIVARYRAGKLVAPVK